MNALKPNNSVTRLCLFIIFWLLYATNKAFMYTDIDNADICVRTPYFFDSAFHDRNNAWVIPKAGGDLYLTKDGGKRWERISGERVGGFGHISFIDSTTGWMIGGRGIWKTQDGGMTWSEVDVLNPNIDILRRPSQLLFINRTEGLILEAYRGIWHTSNSGKTWQIVKSTEAELLRAYFSNFGYGMIVSEGAILNASIQNRNLVLEKVTTPLLFSIDDAHFIAPGLGWVLSDNSVYRYDHGGKEWHRLALKPSQIQGANLVSIHFISKQIGWSCGSKVSFAQQGNVRVASWTGFIYQTKDGGRSWQLVYEKKGLPFDKVYFGDVNNGWVLAHDKVLRSIDGGATWTEVLDMKVPIKCI